MRREMRASDGPDDASGIIFAPMSDPPERPPSDNEDDLLQLATRYLDLWDSKGAYRTDDVAAWKPEKARDERR